ncbi:MAG: helix-turn-helix transcriptional regulator [Bdellovibrionaceae bacterium]|nr:helix-turn-helix transcriptional regulator [Pseudobdellovibrionaceae bacterium]
MNWDGKRIRDLRRKMSWSLNDLARRLDSSSSIIMEWEIEKSFPSKEILALLDQFEQQQLECCSELRVQAKIDNLLKDHGLDQISQNEINEIEK